MPSLVLPQDPREIEATPIEPETPRSPGSEPFRFSCDLRRRDEHGFWHYTVHPESGEYGELDFMGHVVNINGADRLVDSFYLDSENRVVIVSRSG